MKFELYQDIDGQFRWRLKAANGEIIAHGEGYKNRAGCNAAIQMVMDTKRSTEVVSV